MSSWVADSLAIFEQMSWRLERSSWFSLQISDMCVVTVSSLVVMATVLETVAQRIERMEPSPAVIDWGA